VPTRRVANRQDGSTNPEIKRARDFARKILGARQADDRTREEQLFEMLLAAKQPVVAKGKDGPEIVDYTPDYRIILETLKLLKAYDVGKPAQLVEHTGHVDQRMIVDFGTLPRPAWELEARKQLRASAVDTEVVEDEA
jgi:hypothetical protein